MRATGTSAKKPAKRLSSLSGCFDKIPVRRDETISTALRILALPSRKQKALAGADDPYSGDHRRAADLCTVIGTRTVHIFDLLISTRVGALRYLAIAFSSSSSEN